MGQTKAEAMRLYRERGGDAVYAARQAERRALVDALKAQPCADCGGIFPPECMDFDHVRGVKSFGMNSGIYRAVESILAEAAKCDVVCANCHRIRTRSRL